MNPAARLAALRTPSLALGGSCCFTRLFWFVASQSTISCFLAPCPGSVIKGGSTPSWAMQGGAGTAPAVVPRCPMPRSACGLHEFAALGIRVSWALRSCAQAASERCSEFAAATGVFSLMLRRARRTRGGKARALLFPTGPPLRCGPLHGFRGRRRPVCRSRPLRFPSGVTVFPFSSPQAPHLFPFPCAALLASGPCAPLRALPHRAAIRKGVCSLCGEDKGQTFCTRFTPFPSLTGPLGEAMRAQP